MVQWPRLHATNVGGSGPIPGQELNPICRKKLKDLACHKEDRRKSPHGATKTWRSQINLILFLQKGSLGFLYENGLI